MDQSKIGNYLKELRKENGLTQEQLAERLSVSRRSVSRWETGYNLPDLDTLLELSDLYGVEIRALLEGGAEADPPSTHTVQTIVSLSREEKARIKSRMHLLFIGGLIAALLHLGMTLWGSTDNFWGGLCQGIMTGMMIIGILMTSKWAERLQKTKRKLLD